MDRQHGVRVGDACRRGDIEALKTMDFDPNAYIYTSGGLVYTSALFAAVCGNHVECARWLIQERGALIIIQRYHEHARQIWDAMSYASSHEMVYMLHSLGARLPVVCITVDVEIQRAYIDCGLKWNARISGPMPRDVEQLFAQRVRAREVVLAVLWVRRCRPEWRDVLLMIGQFGWIARWNEGAR